MSGPAKVRDIDTIRAFRTNLVKFTETANSALMDAEGEILKKLTWLETEQDTYWTGQIRKWNEEVNRAKDKVREKRIFKDALGRQQSTIDEEKYLKICRLKLEECEQKLANTRKYAKAMRREHLLYRGQIQNLLSFVSVDLPNAIATLDSIVKSLHAYIASAPEMTTSTAESPIETVSSLDQANGSMSRSPDGSPDKPSDDEAVKKTEKTSDNSTHKENEIHHGTV